MIIAAIQTERSKVRGCICRILWDYICNPILRGRDMDGLTDPTSTRWPLRDLRVFIMREHVESYTLPKRHIPLCAPQSRCEYRVSSRNNAIECDDLQWLFRGVECLKRSVNNRFFGTDQSGFGTQRSQVQILSPRLTRSYYIEVSYEKTLLALLPVLSVR